jgi:hypothetical protein
LTIDGCGDFIASEEMDACYAWLSPGPLEGCELTEDCRWWWGRRSGSYVVCLSLVGIAFIRSISLSRVVSDFRIEESG